MFRRAVVCRGSPAAMLCRDRELRTMQASPFLSYPLTPKGATPLRTLDDAFRYITTLPEEVAHSKAWRDAASLALAARYGTPTESALKELTKRIELALFDSYRLALGWRRAAERQWARQQAS